LCAPIWRTGRTNLLARLQERFVRRCFGAPIGRPCQGRTGETQPCPESEERRGRHRREDVSRELVTALQSGLLQLHAYADRQRAPDDPRHEGKDEVHRVFVIAGVDVAAPSASATSPRALAPCAFPGSNPGTDGSASKSPVGSRDRRGTEKFTGNFQPVGAARWHILQRTKPDMNTTRGTGTADARARSRNGEPRCDHGGLT
jgi:hypothetical protein